MSDQRQSPPGNLDFRRMAIERGGRPPADRSLPDEITGNLKHNRRYVSLGEDILAMQKCVLVIALLLVERGQELAHRETVRREHVWSQSCIRANAGLTLHSPGLACD